MNPIKQIQTNAGSSDEYLFIATWINEVLYHVAVSITYDATSFPWIWKGVSATLQSGRYTFSYPRGA